MQDKPTLLWFRQDLRLADNPALAAAAASGPVLPIFILDDIDAGERAMGGASRVWLHHSLHSLNQSLGGKLQCFRGEAATIIRRLGETLDIKSVYWNRCYEPWRSERDARIKSELRSQSTQVTSFNASLLWEPWTVSKKDGMPYKVFTPYFQKGCLGLPPPREPAGPPAGIDFYTDEVAGACGIDELALLPAHDWHGPVLNRWDIGEQAALAKLESFTADDLGDYKQGRDFPALDSTSRLSPHLHFGEVSPHQVWHRIDQETMLTAAENPLHFQRELGWREFSYYQLYHFPGLPEAAFNPKFDAFKWQRDAKGLRAWQQGRTGFPLVDAGMRELWQTGYMHNRVRMVVASFLVKNLLIDWRLGADWFWDCLLDADLANNSASWQWCAGSGADAAPYFRIFNPVLQSEKFDPNGEYLAQYCPELNGLPLKFRHKPWQADEATLKAAGIELGVDYPFPILDLKTSRERALDRFKSLS